MIRRIKNNLLAIFEKLSIIIDKYLQDILILVGIILMWYGVHMVQPWLSWVVVGIILLVAGVVGSIPRRPTRRKG